MKKILSLALVSVLMLGLVGCSGSGKEAGSRDEANRILLSVSSTVAECEKTMDDYETRINTVKEKDLDNIEKRLDGCNADIQGCNSYKDVEDVKPKYDSAVKHHDNAMKHLDTLRKDLAKYQEEKE